MNQSIFKSNPSCETQIDSAICHLIMEKKHKVPVQGIQFHDLSYIMVHANITG